MPSRDLWVDDRAGLLLDIWPDRTTSAHLDCPHDDLAGKGLTEDDWWRAAQQADNEYVQTALALDWEALLSLAAAHTLTGRSFSALHAATALNDAHDTILGDRPLPPSPQGDNTFGYFDWFRTVHQAEGHWWARHPDAPAPSIDAEALREAFLAVDSRNMSGCDPVAPRQRDLRALYSNETRRLLREQRQRSTRGGY